MAVTWPAKNNYATGDVLTAANMNAIGDDLNDLYAGNQGGATKAAGKNAVLNGAMEVWQRGTSVAIAASAKTYANDRWWGARGTSVAGSTISRQVTNDTTNLPFIQYCARVQRDSGNTSTQYIAFTQDIETVNSIPFAGKTITVSFYARAGANFSASSSALPVSIVTGTGTDQSLSSGYTGQTTAISGTATLTTTWQRFTYTGSIASTATQIGIQIYYTPTGTAGTNDYFEITGVQLEQNATATPFARNASTYQGELAACQRYYWRAGGASVYQYFGIGTGSSSTYASILVNNPVIMRTTPTSIDYSTLGLSDSQNPVLTITSLTFDIAAPNVLDLNCYVSSGVTQFRPYRLLANGSSSAYLGFSAEL